MSLIKIGLIKGLKQGIFILLISFTIQSCVSSKNVDILSSNNRENRLDPNEYLLIEKWVKSTLPSCSFLYNQGSTLVINRDVKIMKCIHDFDLNYQQSHNIHTDLLGKLPRYLQKKIYPQRIDSYLSKKLLPYLSSLSKTELTLILEFIVNAPYGESAKLIEMLIEQGAETKEILIQRNSSTNGSTCKGSLYILNINKYLYQSRQYLKEPILHRNIYLNDKGYKATNSEILYRKDVLFAVVNDVAYLHCKEQILAETLIKINPNLRDTVHELTGETPLHRFLMHFGARNFNDPVKLGEKLISKNNINVKDKSGQTPLRKLLQLSLSQSDEYVRMVEALIEKGANIDLKDSNGVTSRELILKHKKLKTLL